jgi:hypothetical protein
MFRKISQGSKPGSTSFFISETLICGLQGVSADYQVDFQHHTMPWDIFHALYSMSNVF